MYVIISCTLFKNVHTHNIVSTRVWTPTYNYSTPLVFPNYNPITIIEFKQPTFLYHYWFLEFLESDHPWNRKEILWRHTKNVLRSAINLCGKIYSKIESKLLWLKNKSWWESTSNPILERVAPTLSSTPSSIFKISQPHLYQPLEKMAQPPSAKRWG